MNLSYTLVVTTTIPNPEYDHTRNYYGSPPPQNYVTEHLRVTLTPPEFLAVKLALLAEMEPMKDGRGE